MNKWFNVLMTRFLHVESAQFGHERPARSPWRFLPCATCRYRLAQQCRQFALSFESLAWSNRFWSTVGFPVVLAIYITYFSPLFLESCESENSCCPRFILFTHDSFWFRWFLVIKNPRLHWRDNPNRFSRGIHTRAGSKCTLNHMLQPLNNLNIMYIKVQAETLMELHLHNEMDKKHGHLW